MARGARARTRAAAAVERPAVDVEERAAPGGPGVRIPAHETLEDWGVRVLTMRQELADEEAALVAALRSHGTSWERIGWVLRTPSETVRRRYGPPSVARTPSPDLDPPLPLDL